MQIQVIIPGYVDMREPQYDLLEIWSKYLMFDRVRCVEIDTEMTVIGTVFTVFCGGRNDKEQEITYTLLAG